MLQNVRIRVAGPADVQAISEVFQKCGLPEDAIVPLTLLYHVAALGETMIGCACGEQFDATFVVRAVGVLQSYREEQIATHLVGTLLMRARASGCSKAVLLTAEHPSFFAHYGFSLAEADVIPKQMKLSNEFRRRFGASTHYMCRRLD